MVLITKKEFVFFTFLMIFILCSNFIGAITQIDLTVNAVFNEGEEIKFAYSFLSDKDETIKFTPGVRCESIPEPLLELKQLSLKENQHYLTEYSYGALEDIYPSQNCTAFVSIFEPYNSSVSKPFTILTETGFFDFEVDTCKDASCTQKAKVFVMSQNIYLSYNSSAEDLVITTFLKYPNGNIQTLSLPMSIKAEQIGTYEIEVMASKEGYKNMTVKKQFGVIEKEPNITMENESSTIANNSFSLEKDLKYDSSLTVDESFSDDELTNQAKINEESSYNRGLILLISIMVIALIIFLFVIYKIHSKKSGVQEQAKHQTEKMNDFNKEKIEELMRKRGWIK